MYLWGGDDLGQVKRGRERERESTQFGEDSNPYMILSEPSGSRLRTRSNMNSMYAIRPVAPIATVIGQHDVHQISTMTHRKEGGEDAPFASYVNPNRISAYSVNDESRIHDAR